MGTAERRLEMMRFLCRKRYTTMAELAREFGVSVRTIQRDIFELTFLMPIEVKSGRHGGGIYVLSSYTMDRTYMSEREKALLLRVRTMVEDQLSTEEKTLLGEIIQKYSLPGA